MSKEELKTKRLSTLSSAFAVVTLDREAAQAVRPLYVMGLSYFDEGPAIDQLRQLVWDRVISGPDAVWRYKSVFQDMKSEVVMKELPLSEIDLSYHIREVDQGGKPWTNDDLFDYMNILNQSDMDVSKPLWQYHLISNMADGRTALLSFINHAIGDGNSLSQVLLQRLMDKPANGTNPTSSAAVKNSHKKRAKGPELGVTGKLWAFSKGVYNGTLGMLGRPDPPNKLKVKNHLNPSPTKSFAFGKDISLDRLLALKAKYPGATVNDVLSSVNTIMLRRYFESVDDPIMKSKEEIRMIFPYDLRDSNSDVLNESFGNHFSNPSVSVPIHMNDFPQLVWQLKQQIDEIKSGPEPKLQYWLQSLAIKTLPRSTVFNLFMNTSARFTGSLSNVRGPSAPVTIGGFKVTEMRFIGFPPLGLYVGLLTYNGKVTCGLSLDPDCENDASKLADLWEPAFVELEQAVNSYLEENNVDKIRPQL